MPRQRSLTPCTAIPPSSESLPAGPAASPWTMKMLPDPGALKRVSG